MNTSINGYTVPLPFTLLRRTGTAGQPATSDANAGATEGLAVRTPTF